MYIHLSPFYTFLIVRFMYILIANTTWSFFHFWWCTQWNIKLHRSVGGNRLHSLRNWGTLLRIWKIFSHVWTLFKHGRSMQKLWQSMVIQCCWYSLVFVDFGDSCLVTAKWNMSFWHDCHVNTHFCAVFVDLSSFQKLGVVKFSRSSSLWRRLGSVQGRTASKSGGASYHRWIPRRGESEVWGDEKISKNSGSFSYRFHYW